MTGPDRRGDGAAWPFARRRETWSDAAIETAATLLRGIEEQPLAALAARLLVVAAADQVTLVRALDDPSSVRVVATAGPTTRSTTGDLMPLDGDHLARVFRGGQPQRVAERRPSATDRDEVRGPAMAVPMRSGDRIVGAFLVARLPGGPAFDESDLEFLATFADHATVAIELAEARTDRERAALLEDRARIARDLHDTAIQQLFAAGLELRATAAVTVTDEANAGVLRALDLVDGAIGQIRTAVLALSTDGAGDSLRHRVLDVVRDLGLPFRAPPRLVFDGPVDLIARGPLTDDVVAVVREALANVAKHASAAHVTVSVRAAGGSVEVEVSDDGVGMPEHPQRSGLANLESRALTRSGTFAATGDASGTRVLWCVPVDGDGEGP
jgi:signal transduction histidine kinase